MRALAMQASEGETGARNFSADRAWLEAYTRLVEAEVLNSLAQGAAGVPVGVSAAARVPSPLTRTDIARVFRQVYGGTRMGSTEEEFARQIERATVESLRSPVQGEADEVEAGTARLRSALDALRPWCDGQTVCPPELVGNGSGLNEWCCDTLGALVAGREVPNPSEYADPSERA